MPRNPSPQAGFSLVELMVALVLGLILTSGVISVYITSKKTYSLNNAVGQVQESGRFAFSYLESPIRMAGFFGCAHNVTPISILTDTTSVPYDTTPIKGYEYSGTGIGAAYPTSDPPGNSGTAASWTPNLPTDVAAALNVGTSTPGAAVAGTDVLVLHEAAPGGISLVNPYQDSSGLFVGPGQGALMSISQIVVVTDCSSSGLFQINNIAPNFGGPHDRVDHSSNATLNPGNQSPAHFGYTFGAGSQILSYQTYMFYIGIGADKGPSLYEITGGVTGGLNGPQEMVSGVESMQILYGVDTDGDSIPNNFQTADTVANWGQVVSVRIALLVHSDDNSLEAAPSAATTYYLLGNSTHDNTNGVGITPPKDRRLRRVFTETISIRNRLP